MKKVKKHKAWADVGSHGGIFVFTAGPIADKYPWLMHIYDKKLDDSLVPVWVIPRIERKK